MPKKTRKIPKPNPAKPKNLLPDPLVMGRLRYWRRGAIRQYLAKVAGDPVPLPQSDDEHLLQAKELRQMLGGVSDMWLHRHLRRPDSEGRQLAAQSAAG
jgi:hypothetical protein